MINLSTYAKLIQQITLSHRSELYMSYLEYSSDTVTSMEKQYAHKLIRLQKRLEKYHGINKFQWSQLYEQALTF